MKTNPSDLFLIKKNKIYSKWTQEEDHILIENLKTLKIRNKWKTISKILNKKVFDCIHRYKTLNTAIKKGHWTQEEDQQVINLIEIHGKNWAKISSVMEKRTGKQIRQRFLNFLDPKINKEKFSIDEDMKIYKLFNIFGSKWRYYIKYFPDRTADMIKGRYYSSIKFKENFLKIVEGLSGDQNPNYEKQYEVQNKSKNTNNEVNNISQIQNSPFCFNLSNKSIAEKCQIENEEPKIQAASKLTYLETELNTSNSCGDSLEFITNSDDIEMEAKSKKAFSVGLLSKNSNKSNINYNNIENNDSSTNLQNDFYYLESEFNKNSLFECNFQTNKNEIDSYLIGDNYDNNCLFDHINMDKENIFESDSGFNFNY